VKTAGELLAAFFDTNIREKAQNYSDLFSCWTLITEKTGISSAAAHSRIVELERAVLLVEADHPGWIQILQTRQAQLLKAVIRRFPDLEIRGISFRLSRDPAAVSAVSPKTAGPEPVRAEPAFTETDAAEPPLPEEGNRDYFDRIEDAAFLETLKRLETLEKRGRGRKKG
jgi:hypothetical protein